MNTLVLVILILVFGLIGYLAWKNIFSKKSDYPTRRGGSGRNRNEENDNLNDREENDDRRDSESEND